MGRRRRLSAVCAIILLAAYVVRGLLRVTYVVPEVPDLPAADLCKIIRVEVKAVFFGKSFHFVNKRAPSMVDFLINDILFAGC